MNPPKPAYDAPARHLSVVVITLNEEHNLPRLISSLPREVELVVLDSGSQDKTAEIAKKAGAIFHIRAFDHYAAQKNAALKLATRPWVLSLDADEVPTEELWQEILSKVKHNDQGVAFKLPRQQVFLGRALRFGKTKDAPLRLMARTAGTFQNEIHEKINLNSGIQVLTLSSSLYHFSYSSLSDYFQRFNRYTSAVALRHKKLGTKVPSHLSQGFRVFFEFVLRYFVRGGFLDGYPGFVYALLASVYVFIKYAKLEELMESSAQMPKHERLREDAGLGP